MNEVNIINDQHLFSGIFTHSLKLQQNLISHGYKSEFFQFLISETDGRLLENATVKKGFLFGAGNNSEFIHQTKLALNFISGRNWRSFKRVEGRNFILSGPTLMNLSKYLENTIVIGHDLYFMEKVGNPVLRTYMKRMYKLYKSQKIILANSDFTKNDFIKRLGIDEHRILTVYPSFDTDLFHPGMSDIRSKLNLDENDRIVLSVSGDNPNKNVESVLRLMARLPSNYKLIRVGPTITTAKTVENLSLSSRIYHMKGIDEQILADLYRGADLFIFPSLYEGFGIPLVEAMASGTPVLTSNRTCLPEVVGEAGIVCDPFDIKAMEEAILRLEKEDSFKKELIKKGLERSAHFNKEKQFKSLSNALKLLE